MPRRMITPEIFRNEKFGNLDDAGRLFFIGCFSHADDDGRLKASPKYLKALIFPYDNDKSDIQVKEYRDKCHQLGLIVVYSQNGGEYLYCIGWEEHQSIRKDRYTASKLPAPNELMTTIRQPSDNHVTTTGNHSIVKYSIDKNNIDNDKSLSPQINKELKKYPDEHITLRKQVFAGLKERRGYTSRQPAAEAKTISQMLSENLTPDQILRGYDLIKAQPFFVDKNLSMMQVRKDIHEVLKNGTRKTSSRPRDLPTEYTESSNPL